MLMELRQTTIPASQETATYKQSDWKRVTEGWHVITYCTMPNTFTLFELPSSNVPLQEEMFRPRVDVLRPIHEAALLQDAFRQLAHYHTVSDAPRPADIGRPKGRFAK